MDQSIIHEHWIYSECKTGNSKFWKKKKTHHWSALHSCNDV